MIQQKCVSQNKEPPGLLQPTIGQWSPNILIYFWQKRAFLPLDFANLPPLYLDAASNPEDVTIACTRNIFPAETLDVVMALGTG